MPNVELITSMYKVCNSLHSIFEVGIFTVFINSHNFISLTFFGDTVLAFQYLANIKQVTESAWYVDIYIYLSTRDFISFNKHAKCARHYKDQLLLTVSVAFFKK